MTKLFQGEGIEFAADAIKPGTKFDTPFENNCVVASESDIEIAAKGKHFMFDAYDAENVLCRYTSLMVSWIHS
jgi:hypothetical protein